ncbi:helix-turn-helix domain-containing protein [Streptosporangium sp. NPDC000509]|uniref:helix-turn-helix domain-containing protein n=1 Tax=Streptosporangium sp. NPDC000509 TaxID=3366186 RepID=UPI0036755717
MLVRNSGHPASVKLEDLDVICAVLGCGIAELLIPEPELVPAPAESGQARIEAAGQTPVVTPKRRDGRSLPPA